MRHFKGYTATQGYIEPATSMGCIPVALVALIFILIVNSTYRGINTAIYIYREIGATSATWATSATNA